MQDFYKYLLNTLISNDKKNIDHVLAKINTLPNKDFENLFHYLINNNLLNIFFKIFDINKINFKNKKLFKKIQNRLERNKLQNQLIIHEIIILKKYFNKEKISPIFLKGVPISYFQYDDFYLRPMNDIDILVEKDEVYKYFELLLLSGYKFQETFDKKTINKDIKNIDNSFIESLMAEHHHLPPLIKNNISIEVHYRVTKKVNFEICPITPLIIANKVEKSLFNTKIHVPNAESLLLHQVIHFSLNNQFYCNGIAIFDIIRIIEKNKININSFIKSQQDKKLKKMAYLTIALINDLSNKFLNFDEAMNIEMSNKETIFYLKRIKSKIFYFSKKESGYSFYKHASQQSLRSLVIKRIFMPKAKIKIRYNYFGDSNIKISLYYFLNLCGTALYGFQHLIKFLIISKNEKSRYKNFLELDNRLN